MGARILVIDDNASNLDLMLYLLRSFGHEPHARKDGISAWEALGENTYDLILTDILMPGIDGYEFARRAASIPNRPPIIAVTALAMSDDQERLAVAGFDAILYKPIDPQALAANIERFLAIGRK